MPGLKGIELQRADPKPRSHDVATILRQAIVDGRLAPGMELVESQVAAMVNVSRSPVREALLRLAEEGLVTAAPYRGTYVSELTPELVEEVYSMRAVLEEFAVRRCMSRLTAEDIARFEAIVRDMAKAAERGDTRTTIQGDLAFHRALCRIAGHQILLKAWDGMISHVVRTMNLTWADEDPREAVRDHRATLAALKARDPIAAVKNIRDHVLEASGNRQNELRKRAADPSSRQRRVGSSQVSAVVDVPIAIPLGQP